MVNRRVEKTWREICHLLDYIYITTYGFFIANIVFKDNILIHRKKEAVLSVMLTKG